MKTRKFKNYGLMMINYDVNLITERVRSPDKMKMKMREEAAEELPKVLSLKR